METLLCNTSFDVLGIVIIWFILHFIVYCLFEKLSFIEFVAAFLFSKAYLKLPCVPGVLSWWWFTLTTCTRFKNKGNKIHNAIARRGERTLPAERLRHSINYQPAMDSCFTNSYSFNLEVSNVMLCHTAESLLNC